jgi:hypothetical protein
MSRVFKDKPAKRVAEGTKKSTSKVTMDAKPHGPADQGVTLVMATPVKGQRISQLHSQPPDLLTSTINDIEEEDWSLKNSPDVLLLGVGSGSADKGQGTRRPLRSAGYILAEDTPVKKGRKGLK